MIKSDIFINKSKENRQHKLDEENDKCTTMNTTEYNPHKTIHINKQLKQNEKCPKWCIHRQCSREDQQRKLDVLKSKIYI